MSEDSDADNEIQINEGSAYPKNEIIVENKKISDVPEEERIKLDDDTIFRFSCYIKNGYLHLKLSEIGVFCPFIYEKPLNLEKMKDINSAFESCNTLDDVKFHINNLFKNKMIKLVRKDDKIKLEVTVLKISGPDKFEIELIRSMTSKKNETLIELYNIQKKDNKTFKEIETYLRSKNLNDILKKFQEIKNKNS